MPPFLPQAQFTTDPRNLGDVSNQLMRLGDTVGKAVGDYRERNALMEIGKAAAGGDLKGAQEAAFRLGKPEFALQVNNMLQQRAERAEDRSWRQQQAERAQSNADRSFGLQAQQVSENQAFRREQFEWEKDYKEKELGLKRLENKFREQGGYKDFKEKTDVESGLRKEWSKLSGDFIKVRDAHNRVEASAKNPSAAGDLALIFNYMKVLDPGSTVREGEFANAQNAGGVDQRAIALYNSILKGERLSPAVRDDFVARSRSLYKAQEGSYGKLKDQFGGLSNRLGLNPNNVTIDFSPAEVGGTESPGGGTIPPPPAGAKVIE